MPKRLMLYSRPLGKIAHPRKNQEILEWLENQLNDGATVVIPEIADYEVRRSLLLEGLSKSVERLNLLNKVLEYQPITTPTMLRAAELWAEARKRGIPTADPKELDADVILAAQAEQTDSTVVTENVGHLSRFVEAKKWREIK